MIRTSLQRSYHNIFQPWLMTSEAVIPFHLLKSISATTPVLLISQITLLALRNFSFCSITKTETVKVLESLNPTKSMGWDMIPPKLLRLGAAPSLTNIFNLAINSGEYPSSWKKGEWIPVYKKNERTDRKNYRPITVLSIVKSIKSSNRN